ncbi:COG2958 family protein [Nitrosococcus wardiae]|uniref:HrgA protein n=1 Tax=Nitrosococcus wardiae TaxID=1814290 RepID=A0A4P7BW29_9GAMM|nr:HrgA protein [Nitrosococcus wardiae]QBQ53399.1 HrgA protein [Nitrosococcus wardiae]
MALNLAKTVVNFLAQKPEEKFTARQIAEWVIETYPTECREKQKRSRATAIPLDTQAALLNQIVAEIGSQRPRLQKKYPQIKTTEGRPRKYYFTEKSDSDEIENAEIPERIDTVASEKNTPIKEQDLYPLLSEFLWSELEIYSKRIDEKRSSNARGPGGNKWLYPDLVGMEDLSADWNREIRDCVQQYADKKTKLWSFEVKILINRSNVREVFFQTVSNSSWANLGYLVASEIEGAETLKELRMLSSLHGIGFIRLDADNPAESQVMIPANERSEVDWHTANRLAAENKDFMAYIKLIRQFYQTGDVRVSDWDVP